MISKFNFLIIVERYCIIECMLFFFRGTLGSKSGGRISRRVHFVISYSDTSCKMVDRMKMLIDKCRFRMGEIANAFDKDDAEVVSLYEQVKDVARANHMLTREKIHSKHMYVDTGNRYEDGIVPSDVTDLISNIFKNGFRHEHLLMPTCAECPPPNTPAFDAIKRFNDKMVEDSAGQLPPYEDNGKYVSFTCGHTSQGLRCFWHGAPVPEKEPERFATISQDGKLSLSRLQEAQPIYAGAVVEGIVWDVFKWQFIDVFPFIPSLAQEAGNAGHGAAKSESRLEVMLKIAASAKKKLAIAPHLKIPWDSVQREACRGSGVAYKHEIPDLCTYVQELSGGIENPWALYELRDFCRHLKKVNVVRGNVAAALAKANIGKEGSAPLFRLACMKAMCSASAKYSKGDEQILLKPSDINSLTSDKKAQIVMQAETALANLRKIACQLDLSHETATWSTTIGLADVRIAHFVFNKPDEARGIGHAYIANIGFECWQTLCNTTGKTTPCPFQPKQAPTAPQSEQKPDTTVKQYDQQGNWTNQVAVLEAKGFKTGTTVYHIKDGDEVVYTITSIDGGKVKIKSGLKECIKDAEDFLRGKFAVYGVKKEVVDNFDACNPTKLMDWQWSVEEGTIKLALDELFGKHATCLKHLSAVVSPMKYRALQVNRSFDKDELTLVPLTPSIGLKKQTDDVSIGSICLKTYTDPIKKITYNVVLSPFIKLQQDNHSSTGIGGLREVAPSVAVPFWLITEGTAATVNMALKHMSTDMGVKVPVLSNSKKLAAGDTLRASHETLATLAGKPARAASCSAPKKKAARKG